MYFMIIILDHPCVIFLATTLIWAPFLPLMPTLSFCINTWSQSISSSLSCLSSLSGMSLRSSMGFFCKCNTISVLVWGLFFDVVLWIWVKFLSVLFLLWYFCYHCDSSDDCYKLYNNYCKLLSKNKSHIKQIW